MNPNFKRTGVWIPVIVAATFCIGLFIGARFFGHKSPSGAIYNKIDAIMDLITEEYVDEVDTDSLLEVSIPDILAKLDPHSSYISAQDIQGANDELDGSFSGIGISFNMLTDTITVLEVISGGPSEKVGIMPGDRIIAINDSTVAGQRWSTERVMRTLRGPRDSKVKLGVSRATAPELLTFEVKRGDIPVTSIDAAYMVDENTGYIKVNKFGRSTHAEFLTSLVKLRDSGAEKFIIDLRGNGGGFMEMAILMANEFLPAGSPIVSTHGRIPSSESITMADGTGAFQQSEVIVLMDEYSASASEILAGAIQDNDRGLIIGRRSFGKGLVQRQIELPDSSALRLTTARYHTPSGRCIQKTYTRGNLDSYSLEIIDRYNHGEGFNADSVRLDTTQTFHTLHGRMVYGGGGIMPDVYVPNDTAGISSYYINVLNAGLLQKFAFKFADSRRSYLKQAKDVTSLMKLLPNDDMLIQDFATFAHQTGGIPPRWYYINISRDLIVNQLKALIARDALGVSGYYEVINQTDPSYQRAIKELKTGNAEFPVSVGISKH